MSQEYAVTEICGVFKSGIRKIHCGFKENPVEKYWIEESCGGKIIRK